MASKETTTLYQCSECDHCSHNLEEATLHAVQAHGEDKDDIQDYDSEEDYEIEKIDLKDNVLSSDDEIEASSIYNSAYHSNCSGNSTGGPRKSELWPADSTKVLLNCVGEFYHEINTKSRKRKDIWEDIHKVVSKILPDITPNQCEQKWRNMLNSQRKYSSMKDLYGSKIHVKKPDYWEEVSMIVNKEYINEKDNNYMLGNGASTSYRSARIRDRKSRESDSLTSALKSILKKEDNQKISIPASDTELLFRLVSTLEKRESANRAFQREVLSIERDKLACMQKFIENKERHNARRLEIMKEYIFYQKSKKRKLEDD